MADDKKSESSKVDLAAYSVSSEDTDSCSNIELALSDSDYTGSPGPGKIFTQENEPLTYRSNDEVVFPSFYEEEEEWRGASGAPSGINWDEAPEGIQDAVSSKTLLNSVQSAYSDDDSSEKILQVLERLNQEDFVPNIVEDENVVDTPSNDARQYRYLILENELQLLLISDPSVVNCAAALSVNAGYMMDPPTRQGLAHVVAHALFASGKQNLVEETLSGKVLNNSAEKVLIRTSADSTVFSISTHASRFYSGLKKLGDHVSKPAFTPTRLEYAIKCIQSVLQERIFDDEERRHHLDKFLSSSSHPYSHSNFGFSWLWHQGNENSDLGQDALSFYTNYYSANRMTLVLIGQQELFNLEEWAVQIFSGKTNGNVAMLYWKESPYDRQQLCTKVDIVPIKEIRSIQLIFPVHDCSDIYKSGVTQYVKSVIMYQGSGSLIAYLRAQKWATGIDAVYDRPAPNFAFFKIDISVTSDGVNQAYSVVSCCFKYLEMLRVFGPQRWYWDEVKVIADMKLKFPENKLPLQYAEELAGAFKFYPPHHVVIGKNLIREYLPRMIQGFLSELVPGNMRMIVTAKENLNFVNETEEIFGVKYKYMKISMKRLKKWNSAGLSEDFHLPSPNPFIPNSFEIKLVEEQVASDTPRVIEMMATHSIWYLQGRIPTRPVGTIVLGLCSRLPTESLKNMNAMCVMVKMLENMLLPVSYDAQVAGITHFFEANLSGLRLTVHGFNDTVCKYLEAVLSTLFQVHSIGKIASHFVEAQEEHVETLRSWDSEGPSVHALQRLGQMLNKNASSPEELLKSMRGKERLNNLLLDEKFNSKYFRDFVRRFLKSLKLVWFFYGNFAEDEVRSTTHNLMQIFGELVPPLNLQIPSIGFQVPKLLSNVATVINAEHRTHSQSACVILLQTGEGKRRDAARTEIIFALMQSAVERSTEKQEYNRFSVGSKHMKGFCSIYVGMQDERSPVVLEANVEEFLLSVDNVLRQLDSAGFKSFRKNFQRTKMETLKTEAETVRANKYFEEILSGTLDFHRDDEYIEEIEGTDYDQVLEMYNKLICPRSQERRILKVLISSICKRDDVTSLQTRSAQAIGVSQNEAEVERVSSRSSNHGNFSWTENETIGQTLSKERKKHSYSGVSNTNKTRARVGQVSIANDAPFPEFSANKILKKGQRMPPVLSRSTSTSEPGPEYLEALNLKIGTKFNRNIVSVNENFSTSRNNNNNNKVASMDQGLIQIPKSVGRRPAHSSLRYSVAQSTSSQKMKPVLSSQTQPKKQSNGFTSSLKPVTTLANQKSVAAQQHSESSWNKISEILPIVQPAAPSALNPQGMKIKAGIIKKPKQKFDTSKSNGIPAIREFQKRRGFISNEEDLKTGRKLQELPSSESTEQEEKRGSRVEVPSSSRAIRIRPKTMTTNAEKSETVLLKAINKKNGSIESETVEETFDVFDFDFDFDTEIKRLQTLKRWLQLSGRDKSGKVKSQLNVDLQLGFTALPLNYDPQNEIARLFALKHTLEEATLQISKGEIEHTEAATQANSEEKNISDVATSEVGRFKTIVANSKQRRKQSAPKTCSIYDVEKEITRLTQIKRFFDGHIKDLSNTEYTVFSQFNISYANPEAVKSALKSCRW